MEPISLIVGALVMGAAAVAKKVGGQALQDAYDGLKRVIVDRYKRGGAIAAIEEDPSSESQKKALEESLTKADAAKDAEVLQLAKALSQALEKIPPPALAPTGLKIKDLEALTARFKNIEVSGAAVGVSVENTRIKEGIEVENVKVRGPN